MASRELAMRILLHIGQSKTGTTAIQYFLAQNRARLKELRTIYPTPRIRRVAVGTTDHNALADALLNVSSYPYLKANEYFEQFYAECEAAGAQQMILSAEHFWGGHPRVWDVPNEAAYWVRYREKLEALAFYLRGHEAHVIVYLRPQADWLTSLTAHNINYGWLPYTRTVVKYLYENDRQHFNLHKPLLRYSAQLDLWKKIIAPLSITVVPYIRSDLFQGSSIADFLRRANLDHISTQGDAVRMKANDSLTREYIEVKKMLNSRPKTMDQERVIIDCLRELSAQSSLRQKYRLDSIVKEEIAAYVAEDNAMLTQRYLNRGKPFVAQSPNGSGDVVQLNDEQIAEAMRRFEEEYNSFRRRGQVIGQVMRRVVRWHFPQLHAIISQFKGAIQQRQDG